MLVVQSYSNVDEGVRGEVVVRSARTGGEDNKYGWDRRNFGL